MFNRIFTTGNLSTITVPGASVHTFGYNAVDYNTLYEAPTEANEAATEYHYYYDLDRRLARVVMPSGREIVNTYANGVLQNVSTPEGDIEYTYSCSAKVESITRGAASMSFTYDGSLITSITQSGSLEQSLGFAYNSDFDVAIMDYADISVSYTYDDDGLLIQSGDFTIARDADNGLPLTVEDGTYGQSRTFSAYGEQAGASVTVGGNAAFSWSVERDATGRITSKQEVLDGVAKLYEYTYDDLGRLTGVTLDGAVVESYAYGENGARSLETNALRGVADKAYTYAEDHRLLSAGATSYTYDADGFLLTKATGSDVTQYAYASTGELLSEHLPDGLLVEYENDALGRRVAKKIDGQITEKYLWLGRTRLLATYAPDGSLKSRFNYADDRMPVSMTADGQTYYLAYDQVGSLRAVTDANGLVVKVVEYDSFGNVLEDTNPAFEVPFGFAGGLYDADTGLVRFGFRDYDAEIGRWTAKDPIGFKGGLSDLYGYCGGDPVNWVDVSGKNRVAKAREAVRPIINNTKYQLRGVLNYFGRYFPDQIALAKTIAFYKKLPILFCKKWRECTKNPLVCPTECEKWKYLCSNYSVIDAVFDSFDYWNTDDAFKSYSARYSFVESQPIPWFLLS